MTRRLHASSVLARAAALALLLIFVFACARVSVYEDVPAPVAATRTVQYQRDVQPIFDAKCAACHSCNEAPCQLKLTSWDGVERGASKLAVYNATREKDMAPTRLGVDALSAGEWRAKGFFSTQYAPEKKNTAPLDASLIYRMIELGHRNPWPANAKLPDDIELGRNRANECPTMDEFADYAKERANQGMPWAVTGLSDSEFRTLQAWVSEGSVVEPSTRKPNVGEQAAIERWERYLNRDGARERLVARYLYEHLFLAHLYFSEEREPQFFELVRSRTPSGQDVVPVASVRPNDDPGGPFYYRLRLLSETIVQKTHITYSLSENKRARYDSLFFAQPWDAGTLPGYGETERANAFLTFAAIPARARYQFMLDDAEYFVRTFIRGPVCSGQIATDVIRDQFWVLFENPATERYVNNAAYRAAATPLIGVPGQDSDLTAVVEDWEHFREQRNQYIELRQKQYATDEPRGPALNDLWDGDGWNRDALLSIFRHHDNAAVRRGWHGALPDTFWVMDYPLLERSYYQLVVNFNVFGSVSHQVQTRLYFDLIRNEGEYNYLRFLPRKARDPLRKAWYADSGKIKLFTTYAAPDDSVPTQITYKGRDVRREFAQQVLTRIAKVSGPDDVINRCERKDCVEAGDSASAQRVHRALRRFAGKRAAELPAINRLPELTYLRVQAGDELLVYTLTHNRAHSNVAFLMGEEARQEPEKDTVTILRGTLGSYPNFMFDVPLDQIETFADALAAASDVPRFEAVVQLWGVRRTHPQFWERFHDLSRYTARTEPVEAGLFDLSRYENL